MPNSGQPKRPGGPRPGTQTDFIALGSKSKSDIQRNHPEPVLPALKKGTAFHGSKPSTSPSQARMSPTIPEPSVKYIDAPPQELVKRVIEAIGDQETVDGLVCGAIRTLRVNRSKPDQVIILALMVLAKKHPSIFRGEVIVECLAGLLKKDVGHDFIKSKGNNTTAVLACNLLMAGFEQSQNWPSLLVKVFVEDSLGDRTWVNHPKCKKFVSGICTAFNTIPNPKNHNPDTNEDDKKDKEDSSEEEIETKKRFVTSNKLVQLYAIDMVRDKVSRRQGTISATDPTGAAALRNLLKTLTAMCGMSEVRALAAQKLEMWLQNPKLTRSTQDLLMAVCVNCREHNQEDVDVIGMLTRMRLKSKPLLNHYILCLKELIDGHTDSIGTLFNHIVYNELSSARNPTNMSVIASLLQHKPKLAAETLATVCQDLLMQQDDYLRAVRALMREIVRIAKHDVQFSSFALGIMKEPDHDKFSRLDHAHKERFVSSIADLICLVMLVSVSPSIKESINVVTKNHSPTTEIDHEKNYHHHKMDLAAIQRDAVWWLHTIVIPTLLPKINSVDFIQQMHKVLFLKPPETYYMKDNWPPESERSILVKQCSEVPVLEDTIMRLSVIGLSHEHPMTPNETLDLIAQLVRRAGSVGRHNFNPVPVERTDIIEILLSLSQYHHPESIKLPSDYVPPSLAISLLYWTVWQTLLILAAFNASTIGVHGWTQFPILRNFMEMAIINNYAFPLATVTSEDEKSQILGKEMQIIDMEKNEIIEFESHLAAETTGLAVTEETSLLLSQLIAMDTRGPARRPPEAVLKQVRVMCSQIQLGPSLCRSRNPDFLLDIINRNTEDRAMPWLSGLVSSARGDMSMLPVQCLCEYLMSNNKEDSKLNSQESEIISQLQKHIHSDNIEDSSQVISYFLRRLHSPQSDARSRAKMAFALLLGNPENSMETDEAASLIPQVLEPFKWLLHDLTCLKNYEHIKQKALEALVEAAMNDIDPVAVTSYAAFLAKDLSKQDLTLETITDDSIQYISRLALAMAHLLIDRQVVVKKTVNAIIPGRRKNEKTLGCIFVESLLKIMLCHLDMVRQPVVLSDESGAEEQLEEVPWRDTQDEIFLRWPAKGGTAQLHVLISQAMILLLTFGSPAYINSQQEYDSEVENESYKRLLCSWFDENGATVPKAYLMDTQEEALLLPDWLRIRLLHCKVSDLTKRLSLAGFKDASLEQLLVFIQSFGIPYITMDRLLGVLDDFCVSNPDDIKRLTKDNPVYLSKLIEGQWQRGCCNGTNFSALISVDKPKAIKRSSVIQSAPGMIVDVVDLTQDQSEESDVIMVSSPERTTSANESTVTHTMQVDESTTNLLQDLFMSSSGGNSKKSKNECNFKFRNLMRALTRSADKISQISSCISEIHALVSAKKTGSTFINGLYSHTQWSCSLLRMLDSLLRRRRSKKTTSCDTVFEDCSQLFKKLMTAISAKCPANVTASNPLCLLSQSWNTSQSATEKTTEELGQLDWARLEEFLRKQLAFLERDEEIKAKVALVAQILLEEIGSRKSKASRGKSDVQDDKFYASVGTTGLLIDWLQLLDPELLAHRPKLQRKLLFESQRSVQSSMPLKMSAKMGSLKFPGSLNSHQTYLLSLLTEHSNWETVHKCLQWVLSDATADPTVEKQTKAQSAAINVDCHTAMDFLWVCMHTSKIWKGRENKSTSLAEPVFLLDSNQFCKVLCYMVSATTKQNKGTSGNTGWCETLYFELFLVFYVKFGQKELKAENLEKTIKFIYKKAEDQGLDLWWQLLSQLYLLEPFHRVWELTCEDGAQAIGRNQTLAETVTSSEVGSICRMDALVQMLIDRIGYVKETGHLDTRESVTVIQSTLDAAYDASLLLKKLASARPSIVLRQLSLMLITLSGRTWYEFREFKIKNHLLFMSQLVAILDEIGPQLFKSEYARDVDKIFETYFQMLSNYCNKARRQMKEVMFSTLKLVLNFVRHKPSRAYSIMGQYVYILQSLMNHTYSDHDYIVNIISKILNLLESASFLPTPHESDNNKDGDDFVSEDSSPLEPKELYAPYLRMLGQHQDLENVAQVLSELGDINKRKIQNLEPFLPHLTRLFSTCQDSSIRHSALSSVVQCMRASPATTVPHVLPVYLSCLTGDALLQDSSSIQRNTHNLPLQEDEIARDALDFLPEVVILCRERAPKLLQAAFDCGSRNGVGVQPPGTMGVVGSSIAIGGNSSWQDLSDLLAKSLTLLSGLSQSNVKPNTNASTS